MRKRFSCVDFLTFSFLIFLLLLTVLSRKNLPSWKPLFLFYSTLFLLLLLLPSLKGQRAFRILYDFYPIPYIILIYESLGEITPYLVEGADPLIIHWQARIFGLQPSVWLERFTHPLLTDLLSLAYLSYYFLPLFLIFLLYFKGEEVFQEGLLLLVLGYYLSFLGYIFVPTLGPRFALSHLFQRPLEGGIVTKVTALLNSLEHNPRDCFPSGHTQIALLCLVLARRHLRVLFWVYLPIVIALIFSTLYLRYHYLIDVMAGVTFAGVTLMLEGVIARWCRCGTSCTSSRPRPLSPFA